MLFFKNRYLSLTSVNIVCRYLLLAFMFLISGKTHAQIPADTLFIKADGGTYALNQHLYYYQSSKKLSPVLAYQLADKGVFTKLYPNEAINVGITDDYFWAVFTLNNQLRTAGSFYFQLNNPNLNLVQLFQKTDSGYLSLGRAGVSLPFHTRPYNHYDLVFPITLQPGATGSYVVLMDKRGEIFSAKPTLVDAQTFKEQEQKLYVLLGVLIGIMVFNILVNLFLWLTIKDKIHLLYAIYVLATMAWLFSNMGLDFQYLFPNDPSFFAISQGVFGGITMVLMAQLASVFLGLKRNNSLFKPWLNTAKIVVLVQTPLWYVIYRWFPHLNWLKEIQSTVFIMAILCIAVCIVLVAVEKVRQKYAPAWFYLAAMSYLAFSIFKTCFTVLVYHDISKIVSPPSDVQIGLVVESIIIFLGIIYRYNLYKKERENLQHKLIQQRFEMMQEIVEAQEDERKRIAQDIHDDVGSTLGTLLLHISNNPNNHDQKDHASHYEKSIDLGRKAIKDLRNIAHDLLPKDFTERGIFRILNSRVDELNIVGNIRFTLITDGNDQHITNIFSITIYRIINELVNNILKHSQASLATIQLLVTDVEIIIITEDNGIGLSNGPGTKGIGLKNIYSRIGFLHGKINIDDSDKGTSVIIEIPFEPDANQIKDED
jgi:signal transduction histidine kinase